MPVFSPHRNTHKTMNNQKVTCNDKLGHRNRRHKNVLVVKQDEGLTLVVFRGETIPGVAKVTWRGYTKDGKWSHSSWELRLPENVKLAVLHQSWEEGQYVPEEDWDEALTGLAERLGIERAGNEAAIEAFVRRELSRAAERLDANERLWNDGSNLEDLMEADQKVLEAARKLSEAVEEAKKAAKRD